MRPDDMTISCEESYQYYELNRNFGMTDTQADKENNNEAKPSDAVASSETISEAENEPQTKPVVQAHEEEEMIETQPIGQPRPIKPLRRKPVVSFAAQKKPMTSYPLRKVPQAPVEMSEQPLLQNSEDVKEMPVKPVQEEEIKPVVQKFSRRPAPVMSNTFKDKIQNSKPETMIGVRTELFNQNRKRPSMFNKKPVEIQVVEKEEEQAKVEVQPEQQNFSHNDSEMSNTNTETQVADSEIQASESNQIFAKPENVNDAPQMPAEPVQVLEAFEEIPAVISEVVETPKAEEQELENENSLAVAAVDEPVEDTEKVQIEDDTPKEDEIQIVQREDSKEMQTSGEETQTVERIQPVVEETQTAEKEIQAAVEETQISEETQKTAEIPEMEATQNLRSSAEITQTIPEAQTAEGNQVSEEETQTVEETENLQQSAEKTEDAQEILQVEQLPAVVAVQPAEQVPAVEEVAEKVPAIEEEVAPEETKTVETQAAEEIPVNADEKAQEIKMTEEEQSVEITDNNEPNLSAEAEESQSPEKTSMVEVPQSVEVIVPMNEQSNIVNEMQAIESIEENNINENNEAPKSEESETVQSESGAEPNIFEQNSEETVNVAPVQTVEEMESEKPAEAPETMPATDEMNHPDAMVQQMYEDVVDNKQSIGGFKPVDPIMAHEAEQLIADFINTLRNNDFTNETPGMHVEQHIMEEPKQQSEEGIAEVVEEAEKVENNEGGNTKTENEVEIQEAEHEPQILETQADSAENNYEEFQPVKEVEELAEATENETQNQLKSLETESVEKAEETQKSDKVQTETMGLPQEMYQIPVQVITTPLEVNKESDVEPVQMTENSENPEEEETPAMVMGGYKPLSIDDIVELVKERLDHMPKTEMDTPMQLEQVLGANQEGKAPEEETKNEEKPQAEQQMAESGEQQQQEKEAEEETKQSEEEIVMPIYQRFIQPVNIDAAVQTENVVDNENTNANEDDADDVPEISSRSYSSRSMMRKLDPRKRRFLFKSDSS